MATGEEHFGAGRRAIGRGRRWSDEEVAALQELARLETPTREIGDRLGRSEKSVRGKAAQEGIALRAGGRHDRQD